MVLFESMINHDALFFTDLQSDPKMTIFPGGKSQFQLILFSSSSSKRNREKFEEEEIAHGVKILAFFYHSHFT